MSSNRPRISSAPATVNKISLPNQQQQQPSTIWKYVDESGRYLHQKSKQAVTSYAPVKWQPLLLDAVDGVIKHIEYYSSKENWPACVKDSSTSRIFLVCAAAIFCVFSFLLYSLIVDVVLTLILPFYAVFNFVYWFVIWRRSAHHDSSDEKISPTRHMLNFWWCAAGITEFSLLIFRCILVLNDWTQFDDWLDVCVYYFLPFTAFFAAKFYLDYGKLQKHEISTPDTPSDDEHGSNTDSFAWLLPYFLLTYAVRCFAARGFTILPNCARPFLGYAACYMAVSTALKHVPASATRSRQASGRGVSFSDQCSIGGSTSTAATGHASGASAPAKTSSGLSVPGTSAAPVPSHKPAGRFHLSDGDLMRFSGGSGSRGSRRVSLPAGSLVPIKAQSTVSEARGMIADMLAQKDMPPHLVSGLKAVSSLLLPTNQSNNLLHLEFLGNLPHVLDSPYIGGDVNLADVESAAQRRVSPSVTWSTTTSATGLPTVEPEPSRARSSSYWKQKHIADDDGNAVNKNAITPKQSIDLPSSLLQISDGTMYDMLEIERDPYLSRVQEWSLPIFELYADSPETILSRMAFTVFQRSGLFRIFKISKQKFFSFFHALEQGYWSIPYHNRIHATDVLHATYYFTSHKVPAFSEGAEATPTAAGFPPIGEQQEDETNPSGGNVTFFSSNSLEKTDEADADAADGTLASVLSSLELMALYTAAAMHDFDHPGRTNAFLVAIEDKKAILYNDRSVLENHHAASAWQLLNRPENNFVEQLDAAEFKRFRYTIIEAILATDLKRHFEILMDFNGKVGNRGLDWDNEGDKLLTCQVCIKMADINSPTKPVALHQEWTDRIIEEFYAQGDEERERGLPVSPYMDRDDTQLAKLQDSFIAHLVGPLAQAMNEAGLLPLTSYESGESKSELLVNLENNHKHWKVELGEEPSSAIHASGHSPKSSLVSGDGLVVKDEESCGGSSTGGEMETIEEQEDENGSPDF